MTNVVLHSRKGGNFTVYASFFRREISNYVDISVIVLRVTYWVLANLLWIKRYQVKSAATNILTELFSV